MTGTRLAQLSLIMLVVVLLLSGLRSASARPRAQKNFVAIVTAGNELYGQKLYAEAREKYLKAYTINPAPMLLYNVANCYRHEDKPKEAAEYFRKFLDTEPPDPLPRDEFEARQKAQAHYLRITAAAAALASPTEVTPEAATESAPLVSQPAASSPALVTPEVTTSTRQPDKGPSSALRTTAWVSLGVGIAGLVGVIAFDSLARDAVDTKNREPTPANADRVEQYQLLVNSSWAVTGVGLVSGALLYWISRPAKRQSDTGTSLGLDLQPIPGGATASLSLSF